MPPALLDTVTTYTNGRIGSTKCSSCDQHVLGNAYVFILSTLKSYCSIVKPEWFYQNTSRIVSHTLVLIQSSCAIRPFTKLLHWKAVFIVCVYIKLFHWNGIKNFALFFHHFFHHFFHIVFFGNVMKVCKLLDSSMLPDPVSLE